LPTFRFTLTSPAGVSLDVTSRVSLDDLGELNQVVERNLHAFRVGDMSVVLEDGDGSLAEMFAGVSIQDRWRMTVERDGTPLFSGIVIAGETVGIDQRQRTLSLVCVDQTRLLDDVSAATVARATTLYITAGTNTAGSDTLTLTSTAGLFNLDEIQTGPRDTYTVRQVINATQVHVDPVLTATLAAGVDVKLITPFHRYKKPADLIGLLLDAGGVTSRRVDLAGDPSETPVLSESNLNLHPMDFSFFAAQFLQKGGKLVMGFNASGMGEQAEPSDDWTASADGPWVDWNPYRTQAEGEPTTHLKSNATTGNENLGWDFQASPAASTMYIMVVDNVSGTKTVKIRKRTSTDGGNVWSALSDVVTLHSGSAVGYSPFCNLDYDSTRNLVYYSFMELAGGTVLQTGFWDVGGAAKTVISSAFFLKGLRYSKEADRVIGVYQTNVGGLPQVARVLTYRGGLLLSDHTSTWGVEDFPNFKHATFFGGSWYCIGGAISGTMLYISPDDFATFTAILLSNLGTGQGYATVVNGTVRIYAPGGTFGQYVYVLAPSFLGVVGYADFTERSVLTALDDLAVLLNAVFYVDEDGVATFLLRRRLDPGDPISFEGLVSEEQESPIWVESYDFVEVTGAESVTGSAGSKGSKSRNLSVDNQLCRTAAICSSVALALFRYYGVDRTVLSVEAADEFGKLHLMDPVLYRGRTWDLYEFSRALGTYEMSAQLLEQVSP
jgi:hypothetical protein